MKLTTFVEALPPAAFAELVVAVDERLRHEGSIPLDPTLPGAGDFASLLEVENAHIVEILRQVRGSRKRAAEILKISERTLYRKLSGDLLPATVADAEHALAQKEPHDHEEEDHKVEEADAEGSPQAREVAGS